MGLFGPSIKDEIWSQLAHDIGGEYITSGIFKKGSLRYQHSVWEILLDTYTESSTDCNSVTTTRTYTRMRSPFISQSDFWFKLYPQNFFTSIGKVFGSQDIEIDDRIFDDRFILKSNHPTQAQQLLTQPKIKSLIQQQPSILFQTKDRNGFWKNTLPPGTHELYFSCTGIIKDKPQLRSLFELFGYTLNAFTESGITLIQLPNITRK